MEQEFTILENKTIGRNLSMFRKMKDKKAAQVAKYIGISESAYTKYERGESKINIDIIQKVAEFLNINPLQIVASQPGYIFENITNSPIAIQDHSTFQTTNEEQNKLITNLVKNVMAMNEKIMKLLEKK